MKPSRFRAMPVDEFDYEISVDGYLNSYCY